MTRYCPECEINQLDKYQKKCSECAEVNSQLCKDIYSASEKCREAQKRYSQSEKGRITAHKADKKWREENREYKQELKHTWDIANKEKVKEYNKRYYHNKKYEK